MIWNLDENCKRTVDTIYLVRISNSHVYGVSGMDRQEEAIDFRSLSPLIRTFNGCFSGFVYGALSAVDMEQ